MEDQLVVMKSSDLKKMIADTVSEALKGIEKDQPRETIHTISMADLIKSKKYGSRNSIQKYRDEIMAEGNNPVIFVKHGSRYYLDPSRFDDWFMKRQKKHKEQLKIDPRLRKGR